MLLFKPMVKLRSKSAGERFGEPTTEIEETAQGGWKDLAANSRTLGLNRQLLVRPPRSGASMIE